MILVRVFTVALLGTAASAFSFSAAAAPVANSTAAELAAHRIEKLVTLKKIEESFVSKFRGLTVENLQGGGVSKPTFKVIASQEVDQGKNANQVEIILDEKGKALSHKVIEGEAAAKPIVWPDKDPVTLTELALHYVADNSAKPEIVKFSKALKALRVIPANVDGKDVALVEALSSDTTKKLVIVLALNGKVASSSVVDP